MGHVFFRDYAEGDLAEERLASTGRQQKIEERFYVRGDGTRCYYFSEVQLVKLPLVIYAMFQSFFFSFLSSQCAPCWVFSAFHLNP